jgi:hypothetical protein
MPIPTGFDNQVRHISGSPVGASELNTEIAAMVDDDYYLTDLKFTDEDNAFLLFAKNLDPNVTWGQKVNEVAGNQTALDADKATEEGNGFYPTGVFTSPNGTLFVFYQQLTIMH